MTRSNRITSRPAVRPWSGRTAASDAAGRSQVDRRRTGGASQAGRAPRRGSRAVASGARPRPARAGRATAGVTPGRRCRPRSSPPRPRCRMAATSVSADGPRVRPVGGAIESPTAQREARPMAAASPTTSIGSPSNRRDGLVEHAVRADADPEQAADDEQRRSAGASGPARARTDRSRGRPSPRPGRATDGARPRGPG